MALDLTMRILVVEDNRTMGKIVRNLLALVGFKHVENVFDGNSALRLLRENQYGLVISDWNMQPMTGHALLKEIRADPTLRSIPFLMVTAASSVANIVAAKKEGANGYIVKPFTGETLKQRIAAIFASGTATNVIFTQ
jgi:two-component system, chemotaxis family, chemotaxis protein CheY